MMNDITPASVLSLFDTTKASRQIFIDSVIADVTEGHRSPLEVHIQLKCMSEIIDRILANDDYKQTVLADAEHHGRTFEKHNATIKVAEVGTKYDFSKTEDATLFDLELEASILAAKIKARKDMLKTIPESGLADPETGNIIYRAAKSSTTSVIVTLK